MGTLKRGRTLLIALSVWGCSSSTAIPLGDSTAGISGNYNLSFTTQFAEVYSIPQTPTCMPYCQHEVPDNSTFDGTLALDAAARVGLDVPYLGSWTRTQDTLKVTSEGQKAGCFFLSLSGTQVPGGLEGTWTQQLDCHGISRRGVFTATR